MRLLFILLFSSSAYANVQPVITIVTEPFFYWNDGQSVMIHQNMMINANGISIHEAIIDLTYDSKATN